MPKNTIFLVVEFKSRVSEALDLAEAAERSVEFQYTQRLYLYEAAYLLMFSAWESFLEQTFLRFLCGYQNASGVPALIAAWPRPANLSDAESLLLNGQPYMLWHNPDYSVKRSKKYFTGGPHETIINSALVDLKDFAAIRHYVAHRSKDTMNSFQAAAVRLDGASVIGGRAGRLLRKQWIDPNTSISMSWFEKIAADLESYAKQIAN